MRHQISISGDGQISVFRRADDRTADPCPSREPLSRGAVGEIAVKYKALAKQWSTVAWICPDVDFWLGIDYVSSSMSVTGLLSTSLQ